MKTWKIFKLFVISSLSLLMAQLYALDTALYSKISDKPVGEKYNIYYFFSFHCAACAKWSPLFEEQLKDLQSRYNVKIHYAPLALDRAERLMSRLENVS